MTVVQNYKSVVTIAGYCITSALQFGYRSWQLHVGVESRASYLQAHDQCTLLDDRPSSVIFGIMKH